MEILENWYRPLDEESQVEESYIKIAKSGYNITAHLNHSSNNLNVCYWGDDGTFYQQIIGIFTERESSTNNTLIRLGILGVNKGRFDSNGVTSNKKIISGEGLGSIVIESIPQLLSEIFSTKKSSIHNAK